MNPKVFVCHASEDKERFVLGFATKLREHGIDAWVDRWEMTPGHNLIDTIFEEGIKTASAFIAVISAHSIKKPWVREELNTGMVKKIADGTKLIPIVLDKAEVPECLRATLWEKIDNVDSYDESFSRILHSIFGTTDKPPLGALPPVAVEPMQVISNLCKVDSLILKVLCEQAIKAGDSSVIKTAGIYDQVKDAVGNEEVFFESLELLGERGYTENGRAIGVRGILFISKITVWGFEEYANVFVENYEEIQRSVMAAVANGDGQISTLEIMEKLKLSQMLVNHILEKMKDRELIRITTLNGSIIIPHHISAELKRLVREQ